MLVEIAQIDIRNGDKEKNLERICNIIKNSKSDLILFPELFTTGFVGEKIYEFAENLNDSKTVERLSEIANGKIIAGSIVEEDNYHIYNTFILVDDTGIIGKYRKIHLFQEEKDYFCPGSEISVINTEFGRIALAICYDIRFPELFREFMKNNAELVLVCANFPSIRREHWNVLIRARAIENQFFVVACNRVGEDMRNKYPGCSIAVDPWGSVLTVADANEELLICPINRNRIAEVRKGLPVLEDIRLRY
ncbi:MAG: carbon-nitrogen family hydrolase [Candidatus Altiarchaeales archaeon]|nr:MAG: carbon-nitrogen family hydrolase [Candidatus Altiarchaeales archaeon]HDO82833.1 carbon-nitrogen family hydrolase [Candidatus Altiarchaeales archaeon]HEX55482.1 carbon-nitrogen family hydrolase [Candidatus Altiarchaeales archaeon]